METSLVSSLLEEVRGLVNVGRQVGLKIAERLYKIEDMPEVWGAYKTFPEYCSHELGIKASGVSKYLKIGRTFFSEKKYTAEDFLIDGGYKDYEVVYTASRGEGPVEEKYSRALTLTRNEAAQTAAEVDEHPPQYKKYCNFPGCWLTEEKHP